MQTSQPHRVQRLSRVTKIGYGAAGFGDSALYGVFVSFYLFFLTDVALVLPAAAGALITVGVAWDAVTDPLVGSISDGARFRVGRRRPYMLAAAVPLGLCSWLIFVDPGLEGAWAHAYFLLMLLGYFTTYTLFYVPWTAFGAEITTDYDERSSVMSYKMAWAALGAVLGGSAPLLLVERLRRAFGTEAAGWSAMAGVIGAIATISVLVSWRMTRGCEPAPPPPSQAAAGWRRNLLEIPQIFRRNRPFRYVVALFSFGVMAEALSSAYLVYYGKYFMHLDEAAISLVLLIATGSGFVWLPAVNATAQRLGKRRAYALFVASWALGYLATYVWVTPDRFALFCALRAFSAGGWAAMWALGWAMIADVTDVEEFQTGRRREGLYYGVVQFVQKCSAGLVALGGGLVLSGVGYVPDAEQSEIALLGIRLTFCIGVALLLAASIGLAIRYPITRRRHAALRDAIESRRRGHDVPAESLVDLLS
jgi:GPH family glycoside/pentoside/hexuronide:cation symporter